MKICVWLLVCVVVSGGCGLGQCTDEPCLESCVVHLGDKCCCGGGRDFSRCLRSDGMICLSLLVTAVVASCITTFLMLCRWGRNCHPTFLSVTVSVVAIALPMLLFVFALSHRVCSNTADDDADYPSRNADREKELTRLQARVGGAEDRDIDKDTGKEHLLADFVESDKASTLAYDMLASVYATSHSEVVDPAPETAVGNSWV
eukprot:GHVQ01002983.1.p1 GENE.GHVQ01002983.1~~GHVQ01002983.1.p1  ORF type:complete len:203 (+),score=32.07 GHVQ01002983.1:405-1013(+)